MDFRVLGPLEVGDEQGSLALGPRKQRALLARLLLDTGRTVAVERLIDDLWGEEVPGSAAKMVQIYVSGLRKVLPEGVLQTRPPGYCIEIDPEDLDLRRFERLAAAGRTAMAAGDAADASRQLGEALSLWRGPALGEFMTEPFARAERDRLEELQLAAQEERIDADLALGRARDLVPELEGLIERHPLRERLREQLMLALYRSGRQADALGAYRDFRRRLDDELGIDPSPKLRELEQAILNQAGQLDAPPVAAAPRAVSVKAPPGREAELATLLTAFEEASAGARRLVLVAGGPGTGKSTLAEALIDADHGALVIRGDCVEHRGPSEAYLPLLDGLGRASDPAVAEVLAERAPSWLAQLPWLSAVPVPERERGATGERMLREMIEALERLASRRPVILVVEDLQWADPSTVALLSALMRRRHPARLLVVVTRDGPDLLVRELCIRGVAREVALAPLGPDAVAAAFGLPDEQAAEIAHRSGGNAMFIGHLVEHLRTTGTLEGVPATLRSALRGRLDELPDAEREVLAAAAVAGSEFTVAEVAAALGRDLPGIEAGDVLEPRGSARWPDGTVTARFAFRHALHRELLLETTPETARTEMHRRIGERLEAAFGPDLEAAHTIARHYVAGRRPAPAVRFLRLAADQCFARRAYQEGIGCLEAALSALADLPQGPGRGRAEVELLSELGQAHVAIDGWSSDTALRSLERARDAAADLSDKEPLASVSLALATLYEVRGEPLPATEVAAAGEVTFSVTGAELLACSLFHQGAFERALEQADRGAAEFERGGEDGHYDTFPATLGDNAGVSCHDWAALSLWFLGQPDEALRRARRALELSQEPARSYSVATARAQLAVVHACRQEPQEARRWAEATIDAARDRGYAYRVAMGQVLRGWALAALGRPEGVGEIEVGLGASRATGAHLEDPFYLGLLADAHLRVGSTERGLAAVDTALDIATRERAHYYDAELYRLRAELLLAAGGSAEVAEAQLETAVSVARGQGARSLEERVSETLRRVRRPGAGASAPAVAERRRMTVLAWEIHGIGSVAEELDPERVPNVLAACHAIARATTAEHDGHVALEDENGGLLYFGYPHAAEDAPLRALRAGKALAAALDTVVDGVPLGACVGVSTGSAVVGADSVAVGDTPRMACRLAAEALPGQVVASDATRTLCAGFFTFSPSGVVTGETGARTRLEARGDELSPLVGRDLELALFAGRWQQAGEGLGQALLVAGEAGIGKSRLVREFARGCEADACTLLEFQCAAGRENSALYPVADHFQRQVDGRPERLERLVAEAGLPVSHSAPVLATLLGIPVGPPLEPAALKRRTADMVVSYVLAHAEHRPVLVVFEDLHWADPSTLEIVSELVGAITDAGVLLVGTFRPTRHLDWEPRSHVSRIALGPCTRSEAATLLANVAGSLDPEVARTIVERSDGVPLFLEELGQAAAGDGGSGVPASLEDSLLARLDQLPGRARTVAQVGAALGREFAADLLVQACDLPPAEVERGIEELVDAELVRRRGRAPGHRYVFRHALLQETASRSLAGAARRAVHLRVAQTLERSFPERVRHEPELAAHHYEAAGKPGRAMPYRFEAGRLALRRSAAVEAAEQLRLAIDDLSGVAGDERRADLELAVRIPLGNALISSVGYAAPEVADCYHRARELCEQLHDEVRLLPVLYGLWVNALVRAQHERALQLGRELRDIAERTDRAVLIVAERAVGWPLVCMGRFSEAREHLDRVPEQYSPDLHRPMRFLYGQDPAVAGLATGAWALWGVGEVPAAVQRRDEAIAIARELEHPLTLAYALGIGALLAAFLGDAERARELGTEGVAVTEEFSLPLWRAWSLYALGWTELEGGDAQRAAALVEDGLAGARRTGAALFEPYALTVLAEARARAGRREEAVEAIEAARTAAEASGERFWAAGTERVREALLVSV